MKVSIIIPIYNLPELTKRCLDSIPYDEDLEVVAVDDCSTDDMSFLKNYDINLITLDKNRGPNYARNLAMDNCHGEYMIGMDNDDYLITDEFRRAMRELDGTDLVFINQEVNGGFVFELCEENKRHYCAFWTKFVRRELIGKLRCPDGFGTDGDAFFNEALLKKPHTEKYTGIVAYHYDFPREGSLLWRRDNGML